VKRLVVVRHAKATHQPGFADFDRPLTRRGRRDARAAGEWLARGGFVPGLVMCSPALRTRQTWDGLAAALPGGDGIEVWPERGLYAASADEVLDAAGATPDEVTALLVVGHNPAAQEVAAALTGLADLAFPTCAIAVIGVQSWARLVPGAGTADALWTPASAGA
jgi:phosphohistidine phosphatase